ncbi:modulator of levamisole receptor-1 domain-containing protein [Ditylenchus destructor]|uniref:Modulator of levamisole receptor-1 domain-containing protein n=1 Tax=Ditylenchus destructor TaxID=166010 RepID=A0AAD4NK11_9BILA|nr:modulator of levamisole receptor-1 domain-containing protein [Ditylenchus destructor]
MHILLQVICVEFENYNPDTYPDSKWDWTLCRMPGPSLVCDPNQLLNPTKYGIDGGLALHQALERIQKLTKCNCGSDSESVGFCDTDNPRGYTISIAVLRKIYVDEPNSKSEEELVSVFANALRNRFSRGQCQDDAFIVLSAEDNSVWTSTGSVLSKKLSPDIITDASRNARSYFVMKDYTGAFLYMINEYGKTLGYNSSKQGEEQTNEDWWENNVWKRIPISLRTSPWRWWILGALIFCFIILILGLMCAGQYLISMVYARIRHRSDGYSMGRKFQSGFGSRDQV